MLNGAREHKFLKRYAFDNQAQHRPPLKYARLEPGNLIRLFRLLPLWKLAPANSGPRLTHQEEIEMVYVTGDVIPSDDEEYPFKVVFKRGEEVASEWLVDSQKTGEDQIIEVLQAAAEESEEDEDDDDDDGSDDDKA
jgi:hypothetical protein